MPVTIVVPQLGESVVEGTIGKWMKKVGDPIAKDEPVVEIITDKINIELPAPTAGTLGRITIPEGVVAEVGAELGVILAPGESLPEGAGTGGAGAGAAGSGPASAGPAAASPHVAAPMPLGPAAAPAPGSGAQPHGPHIHTPVSAPIPASGARPKFPTTGAAVAEPSADGRRASPVVRKLAREHGIDLGQVRGSGSGGRVTREDVLTYIETQRGAAASGAPSGAGAPATAATPLKPIPVPTFAAPGSRDIEAVPLTNVRKKIAENMVRSRHTAAHCAVEDEVDMTALVELRGRLKQRVRDTYGVNLTYMPFIVRAVVRSLREYPVVNASITDTEVQFKKYYNIGVAVHRDQGLIVPVVKDADRKTLLQIAQEMDDLSTRARNDRLTLDDIQGGTFTITNAGMFGATSSTPIINHPEVGILGVHLIQERPVVRDHRIAIRWMMTVSLSFDHRLVDGTPAVQFLHRVKELLEDPESWLLDSI